MAEVESLLASTMPDSGGEDHESPVQAALVCAERTAHIAEELESLLEAGEDALTRAEDSMGENVEKKLEIENAKLEIENDLAQLFDEHNVPAEFRTFISEQGVKSMASFAATSAQMEKLDDNLIIPAVEYGCSLTIGSKSSVR